MKYKILFLILIVFLISGCTEKRPVNKITSIEDEPTDKVSIEGEFVKNLGHPFSGPAIMTAGDYYGISGEKAQSIMKLEDGTKIIVKGSLQEEIILIPEAGEFVEATEKVINVNSFEILE